MLIVGVSGIVGSGLGGTNDIGVVVGRNGLSTCDVIMVVDVVVEVSLGGDEASSSEGSDITEESFPGVIVNTVSGVGLGIKSRDDSAMVEKIRSVGDNLSTSNVMILI